MANSNRLRVFHCECKRELNRWEGEEIGRVVVTETQHTALGLCLDKWPETLGKDWTVTEIPTDVESDTDVHCRYYDYDT